MKVNYLLPLLFALLCSCESITQNSNAIDAIKEADLKRDLYAMADDHFRGRESGTLDELKVSVWLAEQARLEGLEPAGDDGTYFQFFNLQRSQLSENSSLTIGNRSYALFKDALPMQSIESSVSAPTVYIADFNAISNTDLKNKVAIVSISSEGIHQNISIPGRRYYRFVYQKYAPPIIAKGAAAIIFIADEVADTNWKAIVPYLQRGDYQVDVPYAKKSSAPASIPSLWLHASEHDYVKSAKLNANIQLRLETFEYPSVNIVGKVTGTDSKLKKEYVLFSAHQDHDGVRTSLSNDSIFNGADDNASGSVALLAILRAFKKAPAKRSGLFVWHGAEERSMLGSRWFANYPTVPKEDIVAVLNADMIGQNNIDSMALLGSQAPHKNSSDLVAMALEANAAGPKFKLDTEWDKVDHPEGFYFRSDHMPYARVGIPAIFYTSWLHPDYHTPRDEPQTINYKKLLKVAQWMYLTGWAVANNPERPKVDEGFQLERP